MEYIDFDAPADIKECYTRLNTEYYRQAASVRTY